MNKLKLRLLMAKLQTSIRKLPLFSFTAPALLYVIFGQRDSTVLFLESSSFLHGNPSKQNCSELLIVEW